MADTTTYYQARSADIAQKYGWEQKLDNIFVTSTMATVLSIFVFIIVLIVLILLGVVDYGYMGQYPIGGLITGIPVDQNIGLELVVGGESNSPVVDQIIVYQDGRYRFRKLLSQNDKYLVRSFVTIPSLVIEIDNYIGTVATTPVANVDVIVSVIP